MDNHFNDDRDEDSESDAYSVWNQYDWRDTDPSIAFVESVAEAVNRDEQDIAPLYHVTDPEAVNTLLTETTGEISLTLIHYGLKVSLQGTGRVTVEPD